MPHELLAVAHRLGRQHGVVADDDGVLEAAAADEAVLDEVLDLLVKTKRPRLGDLALPRLGRQLDAEKLGEPSALVGAGARDLEAVVREGGYHRAVVRVLDRLGDLHRLDAFRLRLDAGIANHLAELPRAAVGHGRFARVNLDDGVSHPKTVQGRQHMLHRLHLGVALGERGRAVGLGDVPDLRRDLRAAVEIHSAKDDAGIRRSGQQGHRDLVSAVQADAGKARRLGQCLLLQHGAHLTGERGRWQGQRPVQPRIVALRSPRRRSITFPCTASTCLSFSVPSAER